MCHHCCCVLFADSLKPGCISVPVVRGFYLEIQSVFDRGCFSVGTDLGSIGVLPCIVKHLEGHAPLKRRTMF